MRWGAVAVVGLAGVLAGCSFFSKKPAPQPEPGTPQSGIASWYGPGFHGRRTANGEIYDQYQLTAAHQTLPLGTRVRVTNLTNGRAVLVRINDRGPFVDDRIIDLSYAAARQVDMIGPGTAPVRVELLAPGEAAPLAVVAAPAEVKALPAAAVELVVARASPATYAVQIGAFTDYERARRAQHSLESRGAAAHLALVEEGGTRYYRLRVGPFTQREQASQVAQHIAELGFPALIVASGTYR